MQNLFTFLLPYLTSPITWLLFAFGACIGSFLNVCIIRIPAGTFWSSMRSHCPSCNKEIPVWHNTPIISWLLLRGRAACCGAKLSVQYVIVEVMSAVLFVIIYWKFPFFKNFGQPLVVDSEELIRFIHAGIFTSLLVICSAIDFKSQIIPDKLSLPMIALTPVVVYFHPQLDWQSAGLGVLFGGGVLYGIAWLYYLIRREAGLGMGDVKLLAGIGGWLGYQSLFSTLLVASVAGSLVGMVALLFNRSTNLKTRLPFGPFLSAGAWIYLIFGQELQELLWGRG